MSKNLLQDIKIKHLSSDKTYSKQAVKKEIYPDSNFSHLKSLNQRTARHNDNNAMNKNGRGKSRYALWFIAVISFLFFLFALSYLFLKIEITVNPKTIDMVLNEDLSADKNAKETTLPFDLIVISGEEKRTVNITGEMDVLEKAKGVVVIYNTFSSASQRLDINTRLEGSNGKIYKTEKQVIVPGMKDDIPGSVEVNIYGNEGGEEYNSSPLDFTIVGFKGTSKYTKFYARSKGEIVDGFKGKVPMISDTDKSSTVRDMKDALQEKLFKKATDQIPDGFILFKNAIFLDIKDSDINVASLPENTQSSLTLSGTLYGFLFNEEKLTQKIIANNTTWNDGGEIFIPNLRNLTFTLFNEENVFWEDVKNIDFNLSGSVKIVWKLDENKLKADLLGKSKKDFNQILLQYPNIDSADLVISPFWKMSFPDKIKDIKVVVNYPK